MLLHGANCAVNCECEGDKSLTFAFRRNKATVRTTSSRELQASSKRMEAEGAGGGAGGSGQGWASHDNLVTQQPCRESRRKLSVTCCVVTVGFSTKRGGKAGLETKHRRDKESVSVGTRGGYGGREGEGASGSWRAAQPLSPATRPQVSLQIGAAPKVEKNTVLEFHLHALPWSSRPHGVQPCLPHGPLLTHPGHTGCGAFPEYPWPIVLRIVFALAAPSLTKSSSPDSQLLLTIQVPPTSSKEQLFVPSSSHSLASPTYLQCTSHSRSSINVCLLNKWKSSGWHLSLQ